MRPLASIPTLEYLTVKGTNIPAPAERFGFQFLTQLKHISLNCQVNNTQCLTDLQNLRGLAIESDGPKITEEVLEVISKMTFLRHLSLESIPWKAVRSPAYKELAQLTNLDGLKLGSPTSIYVGTHIEKLSPEVIASCSIKKEVDENDKEGIAPLLSRLRKLEVVTNTYEEDHFVISQLFPQLKVKTITGVL